MRQGPIVVGVDSTPDSVEALRRVLDMVRHDRAAGGLDLVVVYVRHNPWTGGLAGGAAEAELVEAVEAMEDASRKAADDVLTGEPVTWRFVVREGDPTTELVKEAEEQHASGVAVGGHRHSRIGGVLTHSVDASLVHAWPGSVLIVREQDSGTAD